MNPSDREFYPLRDASHPASTGAVSRKRRTLDVRPAAPERKLTVVKPQPQTPEYHAGYAAGRRSVDRAAWCLISGATGSVLAALIILVGSNLLAVG